jgi:hypothetical protein
MALPLIPDTEEINLVVDFNQLEGDQLSTPLEFSLGPWSPREGHWARLVDGEGYSCLGYIRRVHNGVVEVEPDWATWLPEPPDWTTWRPPRQTIAERTARLYEALRRSHEQPDEGSPLIDESSTPGPEEQERSRVVLDQA